MCDPRVFENRDLQDEFNRMFEYTCKLESMIRYKDKDIERLSYLNQYLTESQKKRDDIILECQKEIQRLKQMLILNESKKNENAKKELKEANMVMAAKQDIDAVKLPRKKIEYFHKVVKTKINIEKLKTNQAKLSIENSARTKTTTDSKIPVNRVFKPIGMFE